MQAGPKEDPVLWRVYRYCGKGGREKSQLEMPGDNKGNSLPLQ